MRSGLKIVGAAAFFCAGAAGAAFFEPMFKFTAVSGDVRVFRPGASEAVPALEQHAYPYGSRVVAAKWDGRAKTPRASANIMLSGDHWFLLSDGTDISVLNAEENPADNKVFEIRAGKVRTSITVPTVKTGSPETDAKIDAGLNALTFRVPNGVSATRLTERNLISVDRGADGAVLTQFTTENGTMTAKGPQFEITQMKRQAQVEFYGGEDYTRITDLAGDFTGKIEKGAAEHETVEFKTRSVAKIWRSFSKVGGRMAVSVMILPPDGKTVKSYSYLEGDTVVQSPFMPAVAPAVPAAGAGVEAPPAEAADGGVGAPSLDAPAPDASADAPAADAPVENEDSAFDFSW